MLTTYHHAFLKKGGGEFEIFSISEKLKRHGLIADIYGPHSRSLEHYDVVLHFSVHGGGLEMLQHINSQGKPMVLWPNLWLTEAGNELTQLVNQHVGLANSVVFKSRSEEQIFANLFDLPAEKTRHSLTLADSAYLKPSPHQLFPDLYNLKDYAICLGIIEPNKNQLATIKALKAAGITPVMVGGHRDEVYYQACREAGGEGAVFLEALPSKSEILRSALRDALFYIETSFEPPGLSAIEAGLAGCRLVVSDSDWTREHFADLVLYCDPYDLESISAAIAQIRLTTPGGNALQSHLKKHCADESITQLVAILRGAT
ncbi:mannosyltransferase [Hydrogenophaga sp. PAMC20947]|nr:mannosyltransferase [Hydrogenophaga sp. PAMC20947]